ncbi:MAG: bile acid:sodium symporter [Odoribacteraceae bacterium]|jgi:BASS family bile acid:Na+ symporter|nr:bile acid:sodium symporter [Odoribacteraceae bacterium]
MSRQARAWLLPLAMLAGGAGYPLFERLAFLAPCLIFVMLLLTWCDVSPRAFRFHRAYWTLLAIQLAGSAVAYAVLSRLSPLLGEGAMICILAPTAMAAAVITAMLGGNATFAAMYMLVGNLCTAFAAPLFFAWAGAGGDLPFLASAFAICSRVLPLLLLPLLVALLLARYLPPVHRVLRRARPLTYYLWAIGLVIVSGKTVSFIVAHGSEHLAEEAGLALVALALCVAQFLVGRRVGKRHGETIPAGQSLGQKNTVLAIWMAQLYLHPLASIAPAAYVLWQNSINSYQLWRHDRRASPPRC